MGGSNPGDDVVVIAIVCGDIIAVAMCNLLIISRVSIHLYINVGFFTPPNLSISSYLSIHSHVKTLHYARMVSWSNAGTTFNVQAVAFLDFFFRLPNNV